MKKDKWIEILGIFESAHSDFSSAYHMAKKGSNAEKRKTAQRKVDNSILMVKTWMEIHPDLMTLLVGNGPDGYQNAIKYDDFIQERYFDRNMTEYLNKMKKQIDSM